MRLTLLLGLAVAVASATLLGEVAQAAMVTASTNTILSRNGTSNDAEDNFGGRTEIIVGTNSGSPRIGLFRSACARV